MTDEAETEPTWFTDSKGNRCNDKYFGSAEAAQEALISLKDCENCENCSRCSDCSDCSRCSGCSGCSRCSDCSDCSDCSRCSDCSDCSRCSGCSDCSRCLRCSDCSRCSRCLRCSDCSRCSGCSDCSRCSGCSRCSHIANLWDKKGLVAQPVAGEIGAPPVPRVENIHQKIFEAVSMPGALDMGTWHKCEKTHCRAGWIVTLAGEAGRRLERFHNTELAAMLIYYESGYHINPARFYDNNDRALADMKRLAEESAVAQ